MKPTLDDKIHKLLNEKIVGLEKHFDADFLTYFGPFEGGENFFLKVVEEIGTDPDSKERI